MGWFEYSGNFHIHSTYSDGSGSVSAIARQAQAAGIDFIIITDHGRLDALDRGEDGYVGQVLVITGMEVNQRRNHYLALNIDKVIKADDQHPQAVIDQVNQQGGLGIIAHPMEKGSPLWHNYRCCKWDDWSVDGFQGIEVWNLMSLLRDRVSSLPRLISVALNPAGNICGPSHKALNLLDQLNSSGRQVFAYGGSDAHGLLLNLGSLRISLLSYFFSFHCINLHILGSTSLSGEAAPDRQKVYDTLRRGRFWIANDYYRNSRGFRFDIISEGGQWSMGDKASWQPGLKAVVLTPYPCLVSLLRNGAVYAVNSGSNHVFTDLPPGVYRVEARLKRFIYQRAWIFSNPIWLEPETSKHPSVIVQ